LPPDERLKWLDSHREELATEICRVGSNSFGKLRTYDEIVLDLARKQGLDPSPASGTPRVEEMIFDKILSDTRKRLTKEQWDEIIKAAEDAARKHGKTLGKEATGFGLLAAAQMSGFGIYLLGSTLLGAINGALGLGLGFGAFAGLSSAIATVIGPFGWVGMGVFAIKKLAAPNYKKLLPVVIIVAIHRKMLESEGGSFDLPVGPPLSSPPPPKVPTREEQGEEAELDQIALEWGDTRYSDLSEKDKELCREMLAQRIEAQRPSQSVPNETRPGEQAPPPPMKPKTTLVEHNRKRAVTLVAGDRLSAPPAQLTDNLRKDYRNYYRSVEFTDEALQALCRLDRDDRRSFESGFGDMNAGLTNEKHYVSGTSPLVWQRDVGKDGRIYFRRISASGKLVVMLIGRKSTQKSDYRKLRRKHAMAA
jgi:uncharacterized protein YaaW (UPF0174 family)